MTVRPRGRPAPKPPSPRLQRRIDRTKQLLLDAARATLEERGWADTGVQEIIDRADLSRTTLYNHYVSKEALVADVVDELAGILLGALFRRERERSANREREIPSLRKRAETAFRLVFDTVREHRKLFAAIAQGIRASDELAARWRRYEQARERDIARYIEQARRSGIVRPEVDVRSVAVLVSGTIEAAMWATATREDVDSRALERSAVQLYWNCVFVPPEYGNDYRIEADGRAIPIETNK